MNNDNKRIESVELEIQSKYEEACKVHFDYIKDWLLNSNIDENENIVLIGLLDALNIIIQNHLDVEYSNEHDKFCEDVLNLIDCREDKMHSLIILSKLCSEMILRTSIAQEVISK